MSFLLPVEVPGRPTIAGVKGRHARGEEGAREYLDELFLRVSRQHGRGHLIMHLDISSRAVWNAEHLRVERYRWGALIVNLVDDTYRVERAACEDTTIGDLIEGYVRGNAPLIMRMAEACFVVQQ